MVESLKKIVRHSRHKKEAILKQRADIDYKLGTLDSTIKKQKELKLKRFTKYEDLMEQYNFAKQTVKSTTALKLELSMLKESQDQFLNRIGLLKHKLVRDTERNLRSECELQIMEKAFKHSAKW